MSIEIVIEFVFPHPAIEYFGLACRAETVLELLILCQPGTAEMVVPASIIAIRELKSRTLMRLSYVRTRISLRTATVAE